MKNKMLCYQCQETAGCTVSGMCGKTPAVASMQNLPVLVSKAISATTAQLRAAG